MYWREQSANWHKNKEHPYENWTQNLPLVTMLRPPNPHIDWKIGDQQGSRHLPLLSIRPPNTYPWPRTPQRLIPSALLVLTLSLEYYSSLFYLLLIVDTNDSNNIFCNKIACNMHRYISLDNDVRIDIEMLCTTKSRICSPYENALLQLLNATERTDVP